MSSEKDKLSSVWAQVAYYSSLGFILPAGAAGGYLIGWFLDGKLRTSPVLTIICTVMGAVGGFIEVFRILLRAEKIEEQKQSNRDRREG